MIRDALLKCGSIDECRLALLDRQQRIQPSNPDILTLYGDLLQRSGMFEPESSLPAPKGVIKAALIADAQRLHAQSEIEGVETIRTCYSLLAGFVNDDVAARNRDPLNMQPEDIAAINEETQRLIREFDNQVSRKGQ